MLPREEEPQIIVPMIDVMVAMPGASAREVEERVTKPMEKLLWEIPGVEYVYSTSSAGMGMAIVRFKVGEDEEKSIVKLNQKMYANFDLIPAGASPPLVKPRSIDDVPILALTLHSARYNDFELRRVAAQVHDAIKQTPDVSEVTLLGGQRRGGEGDAGRHRGWRLPAGADAGDGRARPRQPAAGGGQVRDRQPGDRAGGRRLDQGRRRRRQRGGGGLGRQAGLSARRGVDSRTAARSRRSMCSSPRRHFRRR